MIESLIKIIMIAVLNFLFGLVVDRLLKWTVPEVKKPDYVEKDDWELIRGKKSDDTKSLCEKLNPKTWVKQLPGFWIGYFDRLIYLIPFLKNDHYEIIAAWLVFKIAAKWEAWKNIIQFPDKGNTYTDLKWYRVKRIIGAEALRRLTIGTAINILLAASLAKINFHMTEIIALIQGVCIQ